MLQQFVQKNSEHFVGYHYLLTSYEYLHINFQSNVPKY